MDSILTASRSYESWLLNHLGIAGEPEALALKHELMKEGEFPFLRATFYRWAQRWETEAGDLATPATPRVLAVGDLHVENFGTWRDVEGRLVWGINDFDEACEQAWTSDLVRLATSAMLARENTSMPFEGREICKRILGGYRKQLFEGRNARAFILAEDHDKLSGLLNAARKSPADFWKKLRTKKTEPVEVMSPSARAALESALPEKMAEIEWRGRKDGAKPPGLGSIGRKRFYAIAPWRGAWIAREAKALAPSSAAWVRDDRSGAILIGALMEQAVRCPDPWFDWRGDWLVRRLAPDAVKIEFGDLDSQALDLETAEKMFESMGAETANIHLGSSVGNTSILADSARREAENGEWLFEAAELWREKIRQDYAQFAAAG